MSKMLAEIRRIVSEDISNRVTQYDVLYESITNAVHANATEINCKLISNEQVLEENGQGITNRKVDAINISDNGNGFTKDNYDSFCNYRTKFKQDLGCKGVGRFIFLKVYTNAKYLSELINEQEEREFTFDYEFDTDNLKEIPKKVVSNHTEVSFNLLTSLYHNPQKHIDRRIDLDLELIRQKVLQNITPTLFFYKKKKNVNILINFINSFSGNLSAIKETDIPDFIEKNFEIIDKDGNIHSFTLYHSIENNEGNLFAYYCANNRTVCEFSEKDFKISLPYSYSGIILLESKYFDERVNNERNDFGIFPVKTDTFSTLSWEMINKSLKSVISEIVKEAIPETEKINKKMLEDIQEERPFLMNFIDDEEIDMAGFMDKKHIIERAKKKFDTAKEKVLNAGGKDIYTNEELNDAIQLAQNELVSYINDRVQVLERLIKLVNKKERIEEVIHNLFMERYTDDNYFSVGKNNLWLLDDRFTSYTYAASEKRINEVLKEIGEEGNENVDNTNDRPDLSLFFSHNPNNPQKLKSVLIEIKPFDYKSKSDRKKFAGIQQLVDYVKAFKNKEKIEEIFAFLITDIDEKLSERLKTDDYTALFSINTPIYHRFYKEPGISIYVISAETLIYDAEARNKVFLDIIRKQSNISKFLNK